MNRRLGMPIGWVGQRMKTAASPAGDGDNKAVQEEGEKKEKWVSDEVLKCF